MTENEIIARAVFACIADVHVGNHGVLGGPVNQLGLNDRCRLIHRALHHLARMFEDSTATPARSRTRHPQLAIAGDLFDSDKPSPAILAQTMEAVGSLCRVFDGGVHIIPGNHDRTSEFESALAPFDVPLHCDAQSVTQGPLIWAAPCGENGGTLYLAFQSKVPPIEHIRDSLENYSRYTELRRVVMHYGIMDDATPPWLRNAADAVHVDELIYELQKFPVPLNAYAGNWHDQKSWTYRHGHGRGVSRRGVYQCGAFVSTGFDNEGSRTGRAWVEHEDGSVHSVQCNPIQFETVHDVSELPGIFSQVAREWEVWDTRVHQRFLRVVLDPAREAEERAAAFAALNLRDDAEQLKGIVRMECKVRDREGVSQEQAQAVARASTSGVSEALAAYVAQMQLPPGVDRAEVLAEARRLVKLEDA